MSFLAVAGALTMMVFGGIGIDMMYAELNRNKMQNTLDRAVLAAADMNNTLDPDLVVNEYLSAMGLDGATVTIDSQESALAKVVSADGYKTMPSNFLGLLGVDNMQASGGATASNALNGIEISLVLDVSGSMAGAKMDQLKAAAKSFIDTVIPEGSTDGQVTINLVPYSAVVSLGDNMSEHYDIASFHEYSNCVLLDDDQFTSTQLDDTDPLQQLAHFDLTMSTSNDVQNTNSWCPEGNKMSIVPLSSNPAYLKAQIDLLEAGGNTAIDMGVKWGAALLDPSSQSIVADMIDEGLVPATAVGRPFSYSDPQAMKYIIVMTDGENTSQYNLRSDILGDNSLSDVWVDTNRTEDRSDDVLSIRMSQGGLFGTGDVFMWTHLYGVDPANLYQNGAYSIRNQGAVNSLLSTFGTLREERNANPSESAAQNANCNASFMSCNVDYEWPIRLRNSDLYANFKVFEIANRYYWQAYLDGKITYETYLDKFYVYEEVVGADQADTRLSDVCGAAKQNGTVVYAIGVEAPQRGLTAMQNCASSMAHYYDVSGSELETTFSTIARTMSMLRLTQ